MPAAGAAGSPPAAQAQWAFPAMSWALQQLEMEHQQSQKRAYQRTSRRKGWISEELRGLYASASNCRRGLDTATNRKETKTTAEERAYNGDRKTKRKLSNTGREATC